MQSVVFYPVSIIYYLFPFEIAFDYFLIFHVLLGGIFMYFLARDWGYRDMAALVSSVTFMFSGFTISLINLATSLSSVIWLPLVLLYFRRALKGSMRSTVLSGIALLLMFLGGEPSIFYFTVIFLFLYTAWDVFARKDDIVEPQVNLAKKATVFLTAVALALLLSAFQLFPFLELVARCDRPHLEGRFLAEWPLPLKDVANFLVPFAFGVDFSGKKIYESQIWAPYLYIGSMTLFLAALALFFRKDAKIRFMGCAGVLFLLLSFGKYTPLYGMVSSVLPGMRLMRYPVRLLFIVNFVLALLCGAGFDCCCEGANRHDQRFRKFFSFVLALLFILSIALALLSVFETEIIASCQGFFSRHSEAKTLDDARAIIEIDLMNLRRLISFFVTGALILYGAGRVSSGRGALNGAFLALVMIDLFTATSGLQHTSRVDLFKSATPNIEFLKKDTGLFRFYVSPKTRRKNTSLQRDRPYAEAIQLVKDRLCADRMVSYGLFDASGYESIELMDFRKFESLIVTSSSPSSTNLLTLANVRYLATLDRIDPEGYRLVSDSNVYLYRNERALPRAFLVSGYRVADNEPEIAERLKSKTFDPAREVILEKFPSLPNAVFSRSDPAREEGMIAPRQKATIVKYSPNEVIVDVSVNSPQFLVLSDQYYPGWKAYLDQKPVPIYKADFVFRAVSIETAGDHSVRFVYDPFSFRFGLLVSGLTLVVLAFIAILRRL